jgi:hypothetical protein
MDKLVAHGDEKAALAKQAPGQVAVANAKGPIRSIRRSLAVIGSGGRSKKMCEFSGWCGRALARRTRPFLKGPPAQKVVSIGEVRSGDAACGRGHEWNWGWSGLRNMATWPSLSY